VLMYTDRAKHNIQRVTDQTGYRLFSRSFFVVGSTSNAESLDNGVGRVDQCSVEVKKYRDLCDGDSLMLYLKFT
jgi:hypothetical protein